jgi:hypothetical protein
MSTQKQRAWALDQLTRSEFFHLKLHSLKLLEIANSIHLVNGESLEWDLDKLAISTKAWNKAIHSGIKPVILFAHPQVLMELPGSVSYYRMMAMVSQKSMGQVGSAVVSYEKGIKIRKILIAWEIATVLNKIISNLVEADETLDMREFDLWRGMTAGAQVQGSWQNAKGKKGEIVIKGIVQRRLREKYLISDDMQIYEENDQKTTLEFALTDGRKLIFGKEPDIGIYVDNFIQVAVEIKSGIDRAAILERVGATIKSLQRAKQENPHSVTVLIMPSVSITEQAEKDLLNSDQSVNYWFTLESILDEENYRERFFALLRI